MQWQLRVVVIGLMIAMCELRVSADQCSVVTKEQASRVADLLLTGSKVLHFCQPCGEREPGSWEAVKEVAIVGSGASAGRQVRLNGRVVDLAYVYYLATDGTARDLALAIGCRAEGVSESLTFKTPAAPPPAGMRRYKLTLTAELLSSKADGRAWDAAGGLPDPLVRAVIVLDGKEIRELTCSQQDALTSSCLSGTIIEVNEDCGIALSIQDKDVADNDDVGTASMMLKLAIRQGRPVTMRDVHGQLKSVTMALVPAE
jgi:hypothetical protein